MSVKFLDEAAGEVPPYAKTPPLNVIGEAAYAAMSSTRNAPCEIVRLAVFSGLGQPHRPATELIERRGRNPAGQDHVTSKSMPLGVVPAATVIGMATFPAS